MRIRQVPVAVGMPPPIPTRRRLLLAAAAGAAWLALPALQALANGVADHGQRLWLDAAGDPLPQADAALDLLADAASHGLDPQDYDAAGLARLLQQPWDTQQQADAADLALTRAFERYLGDLHRGRIDPVELGQRYRPDRHDAFAPDQALRVALQLGDPSLAVAAAVPQLPQYDRLREALARYRSLVGHPAWDAALPQLPRPAQSRTRKLEPGQPWSGLERLAQRLQALGDLAPGTHGQPRQSYEGELLAAVRRFQQRHGLEQDGVIGWATLEQLEVSPAGRVRQIELTLERLRWTPLLKARRMIVINLPEFMLRAYEVTGDGRVSVSLESRVIVGKALDTRTPLFDEDMRFIEFSPYWNVPPSIARAETVPRLRRDPGYFDRMGFEFVGSDGRVERSLSGASLDAVLAGRMRIRQRPGPENALGDIKFVFPNADNIYLHHTPAVSLFGRDRRDYSHGCIRVEKPVELAEFVLQDMAGWDRARIEAEMAQGSSHTLRLDQPVPVLIHYGTTVVKGDQIFFFNDFYGHDRLLDAALRQRRPG